MTIGKTSQVSGITPVMGQIPGSSADRISESQEKIQNNRKKNGVKVITASSLLALASVGIYLATRGKSGKLPKKLPTGVSETTELKKTEKANRIYKDINSRLHQNSPISPEIIDKNLAPQPKKGTWTKDDMNEYYKNLEAEQSVNAPKPAKPVKAAAHKPVEIKPEFYTKKIMENGQEKLVTYNKSGQKVSEKYDAGLAMVLSEFNPKTGRETTQYFGCGGWLHVTHYKSNAIYKDVHVIGIPDKDFDRAVALSKKYEVMPQKQLEELYKECLEGNPKNIDKTEFEVIEAFRDFNRRDFPITSDATQIKEHHKVNGKNNSYRELPDDVSKLKTPNDYTEEELSKMSTKEYTTLEHNHYIKSLSEEMSKIDAELSALPPLEKDCIFYRGVSSKYIPDIINGKIRDIVNPDKAYAYYAFEKNLAKEFGGVILSVRTPKGAKISRNLEHEGEALFPRNAKYKILSKHQAPDGTQRIELEYLLA